MYSPTSSNVRPTSDKAREAVFNILRAKIGSFIGKTFFDVFAGSGAIGLEALSQGFKTVYFFDIDTKDLQKNVNLFVNEQPNIKIEKKDVTKISNVLEKADVLFMDAPYNLGLTEKALENLLQIDALKAKTLCVIEIEKSENLTLPAKLRFIDERKYGLAKIVIAEVEA